jgi:hypothetical protein
MIDDTRRSQAMIYVTRSGIWEVDEYGKRLISRTFAETESQDVSARFWDSERARMQSPDKLRRAGTRLLVTAVVFIVLLLWLLAVLWELRPVKSEIFTGFSHNLQQTVENPAPTHRAGAGFPLFKKTVHRYFHRETTA